MAINQHKNLAMGKGASQGADAPKGGPSPAQRYAQGGQVGTGKAVPKAKGGSVKKAPCTY